MTSAVLIIVPSQGDDKDHFLRSAQCLSKEVYKSLATIVTTSVRDIAPFYDGRSVQVTFSTLENKPFALDNEKSFSRVITISHGAMADGPNLAYGVRGLDDSSHQPWGAEVSNYDLNPNGRTFWKSVGNAMSEDGAIILFGCRMATGNYARAVAVAANRAVYASNDLFAAGDSDTVVRHAQAIEHGHVRKPMTKIGRPH